MDKSPPNPSLLELICSAHGCGEVAACHCIHRQVLSPAQRGWFVVWGWLFPEQQAKWRELALDLGRCRHKDEILESIRYWRTRHPLSLHSFGASWLMRVRTTRVLAVWASYQQ